METDRAGRRAGGVDQSELPLNTQTLRALIQASPSGIIAVDRDGRLRMWNPAAERVFGWQEGEVLGQRILAEALESWETYEEYRTRALAGETFSDIGLIASRKDGRALQLSFSTAPLLDGRGTIIGTMAVILDVTERNRMADALASSLARTEQLSDDTVHVLAAAIEKRDPYTAGHQQRVGSLAAALAERLGFSPERQRAVRFASIIHDLGKLYIPAEILCKPSRLNDLERRLMETHPVAGYEILKSFDFPWPIASIVHQHHERLDGSGYPAGLCRDAILPEARVLGVADVVEAISSHRPYRPAKGDAAALREIEAGAGTRYDPEVAEALFSLLDGEGRLPVGEG